jgi:hypothetical protein
MRPPKTFPRAYSAFLRWLCAYKRPFLFWEDVRVAKNLISRSILDACPKAQQVFVNRRSGPSIEADPKVSAIHAGPLGLKTHWIRSNMLNETLNSSSFLVRAVRTILHQSKGRRKKLKIVKFPFTVGRYERLACLVQDLEFQGVAPHIRRASRTH